jgi:hypothetical protein
MEMSMMKIEVDVNTDTHIQGDDDSSTLDKKRGEYVA